ncbi:hypothetical protein DRQ53_05450 [bacterium]|nr:MAG: hypothetical protein DRQ32_01940 [bacterium]RKZ16772.1 MAG: hypothetical protein DRQ53_05450 [bacterium]
MSALPHDLPRYLPEEPWPPYAYRPGRHPHPTRDPLGHSHSAVGDETPAEPPEGWRQSHRYLRAIDLFNHGFAWEAHEEWESMWHRPVDSAQAEWLQALIQVAAASVQQSIDHQDGRVRLCHRALDHLRRVHERVPAVYMGLEVEPLRASIRAWALDATQRPVLRLEASAT